MSPGSLGVQSTGEMGEDDITVKSDNASTQNALKGSAVTKGCSRFLPKGTKAKVNLEDQGRQKVSFTFNVTKTLRNRFQSAIGAEQDEVKIPPLALTLSSGRGSQDSKSDSDSAGATEPSSSPPKAKVEWNKMHFKKKHLNDAAKPDKTLDRQPSSSLCEAVVEVAVKKDICNSSGETEPEAQIIAEPQPQSDQNSGTSHIGKDDTAEEFKIVSPESDNLRKSSQSEGVAPGHLAGSESEADLLRTSPARKSQEPDRDVKKNASLSKPEEVEKVSSHSKSDRDKRSAGHSKSDRDSRRISSRSKYDREERISSSRSRSDRDLRTSSYSKSDRSRASYYRDKDRGYRRSSPYSERSKSSRSKLATDLREGSSFSDSEDESRRYHSKSHDLRRTSMHSKSYRDSRKYQSKLDRELRATSSCSESERETRRTKPQSKSGKLSRTRSYESEIVKMNSPEPDLDSRKSSKSDGYSKVTSSHSKSGSCCESEIIQTNSPEPDLESGKSSKSDGYSRITPIHPKLVTSCETHINVKSSAPPVLEYRKSYRHDSNSRTAPSHSQACEIEAVSTDSPELDSNRNDKPDSNFRTALPHCKSSTSFVTEVIKKESPESELDSGRSDKCDTNLPTPPPDPRPDTFSEMEAVDIDSSDRELELRKDSLHSNSVRTATHCKAFSSPQEEAVRMDCSESDSKRSAKRNISLVTPESPSTSPAGYEIDVVQTDSTESKLDSLKSIQSDMNLRTIQSRSKSPICCGMDLVRVAPPEAESESWERCKLDSISVIASSNSEPQEMRISAPHTPGMVLRGGPLGLESEEEFREPPESAAMPIVTTSEECCFSFHHKMDRSVSTSSCSTPDRLRHFCHSNVEVQISGDSPSSKLGVVMKSSACSGSGEDLTFSPHCKLDLKTSPHSLLSEVPSSARLMFSDLKPSAHSNPRERESSSLPMLVESRTSHMVTEEEFSPCPEVKESMPIPGGAQFTSTNSKLSTWLTKHIDGHSVDARHPHNQRERRASTSEGDEASVAESAGASYEVVDVSSFNHCSSKLHVVPADQNWDSLDKERLYTDSMISEGKQLSNVEMESPAYSMENEETPFSTRPDSSVKVELEEDMELSDIEDEQESEIVTEAAEPLSTTKFADSEDAECSLPNYQTKSNCDSSCMKAEYNSISSDNENYLEDAKSNSDEDSEESNTSTDSEDDRGIPRNRLQSVVVVPKNSSLTMEEKSPSASSSSSPRRGRGDKKRPKAEEGGRCEVKETPASERQASSFQMERIPLESSDNQNRSGALPTPESHPHTSSGNLTPVRESHDGVKQELLTDTADSTSQPENFSSDRNQLAASQEKSDSTEAPVDKYQWLSGHTASHPAAQSSTQHLYRVERDPRETPDSRQMDKWSQQHSQERPYFHSSEYVDSFDWEFAQPEKPSSSCQQPDSSYGLYKRHSSRTEETDTGDGCGYCHNNAASSWDPKDISEPTLGKFSNYRLGQVVSGSDVQGQVQPDSMTDYFESREAVNHGGSRSGSKGVSSLQAHEITSNSSKGTTLLLKASDSTINKDPRTKSLDKRPDSEPQKQQPEPGVDTDSESDAEPRECEQVTEPDPEPEPEPEPDASELYREWVALVCKMEEFRCSQWWKDQSKSGVMPPYFELIDENLYLTERKKSKSHRDIKRMQCECMLSKEDRERGVLACGEDCLNRLLMIECSSRCLHGEFCTNRRFQRRQYADVEVILTERKGWGLRAAKELPVNCFVLEYCGEVLDHREFKARVKEYARNKNIHYYFMALKNDEIIDATLKGNCSRFMNHSCEPNCETQKWTVNGQLRVGFFTTKAVPPGTELTFDYQFQRYGKEAQKCFCGSANCRGFLGGENRVSIRAAGGKVKLKDKERSRKKDSVDEELEALLENGKGLSDPNQVLSLTRLMVRIETMEQKLTCLQIIQDTHSQACLKSFLEYHGLSLLWIWMTELGDGRGNSSNNIKLQTQMMKTLEILPISTKNMLEESKLLPIVQRWAQPKASAPQPSEADGYSSENTSRAQTPLNTQEAGPKPGAEPEGDTPRKLVMRRLKIISENSMDSALSDTSKASDGEIEAKEGKEDTEPSQGPAPTEDEQPIALGAGEGQAELGAGEGNTGERAMEGTGGSQAVEGAAEGQAGEVVEGAQTGEGVGEAKAGPGAGETKVGLGAGGSQAELGASGSQPDSREALEQESLPKTSNGPKLEESVLTGTPSQDEEEGLSDAESERSHEQHCKMEDVSDLATKLLENWKDLKEVYRIPKKDRSQAERDSTERGRDGSSQKDLSQTPKTPSSSSKEKDTDKPALSKDRKKRKQTASPPPSAYEREGLKRLSADERYDTTTPSKKKKTRSKLTTEERRKLFEQEVAQREAQKHGLYIQQQPMCGSSQVPYDTAAYTNSHLNFVSYPPGYPLQAYVDPVNPNAGKVLLPTPNVELVCQALSYDQQLLAEPMPAGQHAVPTVQHLSPQVDIQTQQYLTPAPSVLPQDPSLAVLQVTATQAPAQNYTLWDPNQQALAVHQQYSSGQPQASIYYQGQPCQPVYSISSSYGQTSQPIVQTYAQSSPEYTQGQQAFIVQPSAGVLVTSPAPAYQPTGQPQAVQQELMVVSSLLDLPPPSPPKAKSIVLPSNWKTARDPEGKIYYYHVVTRQTQWDPPLWEGGNDDTSMGHEAEMDLGTPTYDENPAKDPMLADLHGLDGSADGTPNAYSLSSKKKAKTAEADTSSELAKRSKELFRKEISQFIVLCLNPYRKPDCKIGRIVATEDFKHLARKLTHGVMNKELKQCKNPEDLECNENVKHKTKEYIKKYMQKFGATYKPKEEPDME
eukprot:gi/632986012/ref/XP_007910004.1/ PREDICTED: histone-lysine N-methyltransferase SETD2 isoform X2 [Callorhinchus milii]